MSKGKKTQSPEEAAAEFMQLWQKKWAEMLQEKGWPEGMAMPGMGQAMGHMPFMMPFMGMGGFGGPDTALLQRIERLEKRLAVLESKKPAPPPKAPAKSKAKPAVKSKRKA